MAAPVEHRFTGRILGVGTTAGPRLVVGIWADSPFGPFADVMLEHRPTSSAPDGAPRRLLLAPPHVAEFVATTYSFDEVRECSVNVTEHRPTAARTAVTTRLRVQAGGLLLDVEIGARTRLGYLLRAVPRPLATWPTWSRAIAPLSSAIVPGVRTWGSAGAGRTEAYGAWDQHAVLRLRGRWEGADLGDLARLDPPVRFGFASAPPTPSLTSLVTTIIESNQDNVGADPRP